MARLLEKMFEKSSKTHIFQVFFMVVHVGLVDLSVNIISPSNKTPVMCYCVFLIDISTGFSDVNNPNRCSNKPFGEGGGCAGVLNFLSR